MEERSETLYDIYIRISRLGDRTADEATEVYEAQCRDWANRNGISIDQVEEDTDVSGSLAVAERKLERLIQKVEAGDEIGKLTRFLREQGAISVYSGKPLTKSGVRTMLANRAYVGEVSIQNGTKGKPRVITDFHAPIIPRQIFEAANAVRGAYFPQ